MRALVALLLLAAAASASLSPLLAIAGLLAVIGHAIGHWPRRRRMFRGSQVEQILGWLE